MKKHRKAWNLSQVPGFFIVPPNRRTISLDELTQATKDPDGEDSHNHFPTGRTSVMIGHIN
ncbi:hypothetical protein LSP04_17920 [Levilactobacillus spicheri]|uniref:Uncharacterized protein n=1 Tax=Levilactobacillus spicheri TaxID=216463 RepID=A0ABQ0WQH2_9LACO|nr:hypothetical protein LSP04_17920 [Levilactobacillus spicheri]